MAKKTRYKIQSECPECGCGLINRMAPDIYRQKYGETAKEIDVKCPDCGKIHKAVVTEEDED